MSRKLLSTGSDFEKTAGYSRAVVQGDWCFVSGTTGYDYQTMTMPDDIQTQTENCLNTIRETLKKAKFALEDIVRVNYYITHAALADDVFPIVGKCFENVRPAATMIVCDLIRSEMKIEIEVTALKRDPSIA